MWAETLQGLAAIGIGLVVGLIFSAILIGSAILWDGWRYRRRQRRLTVTLSADTSEARRELHRAEEGIRSLGRRRLP